MKRKIYGPDAPTVGASLRNLAKLVYARNREEGEKLFQEDVDLYARNARAPPFDQASALLGLAQAQRDGRDLAAARATLQQASEIVAKGLSTRHPLYAAVLRDLALVHQAAGEFAEAERSLREALAIVEQAQGADHLDLAQYCQRLAAVYEQAGDYASAAPLYRRSIDLSNRMMADMLTIGRKEARQRAGRVSKIPCPRCSPFKARRGPRKRGRWPSRQWRGGKGGGHASTIGDSCAPTWTTRCRRRSDSDRR